MKCLSDVLKMSFFVFLFFLFFVISFTHILSPDLDLLRSLTKPSHQPASRQRARPALRSARCRRGRTSPGSCPRWWCPRTTPSSLSASRLNSEYVCLHRFLLCVLFCFVLFLSFFCLFSLAGCGANCSNEYGDVFTDHYHTRTCSHAIPLMEPSIIFQTEPLA